MADSALITGPLAEALGRCRGEVNARFAAARHLYRGLSSEDFSRHLAHGVQPVIAAAASLSPPAADLDALLLCLCDLCLRLSGKGLAPSGPWAEALDIGWRSLLPAAAPLLLRDPEATVAPLVNALLRLARETGDGSRTLAKRWAARMTRLAPLARDPAAFLEAGKVAAWREGMACWRDAALASWAALSLPLLRAVLDLGDDFPAPAPDLLRQLRTDPWLRPGSSSSRAPRLAWIVGGFQGFGGPFLSSPQLAVLPDRDPLGGRILAYDHAACWELHADCYGALLTPLGAGPPPGAGRGMGAFTLRPPCRVECSGAAADIPALAGWSSAAGNGRTLALAHGDSLRLRVVALHEAPA